jgi:HTH-type transcriptional regulator / antitoxin HigA
MTVATANANWIMHPGFYLKEEMDARGWLQRDLSFILGCSEQTLNMLISGKRGISPEMAKALADAFDVPAEFFANLQQAYDLSRAGKPDPGVAQRARMQAQYPVREMIKRGWIEESDASMIEAQLVRFFGVSTQDEIPYLAHAAKKSKYEEREIPPAQLAWLFRVRQIAESISVPTYSEKALRSAVIDLQRLLYAPEEARHVPKILTDCGVKFVLVEKLPQADIDGVCFWIGETPIIGMSLRRDAIDNFWFVVRHEIEHVLRKHGRDAEIIDTDLNGKSPNDVSEEERVANAAAADFCGTDKLDSFLTRKKPFYYEKDVLAFARLHQRHPGVVIGQIRRRLDRYDYLTRHLAKIRQFVIPAAITDGWGQSFNVSL